MKLKLSKREIILLGSLGIVLLSVVYYKFLIAPQVARASELTTARDQKRNELASFREEISSQSKLDLELVELQSKVNDDSENYFLTLDQEEIILIINEFTKDLNIKLKAVNFEEPKEETLGEDKENKEGESSQQTQENTKEQDEQRKDANEVKKSDLLDVYTVNLEYESDYYSLLDFLKNVTKYQKKIMIKDITVNKDDEGKLTGNITLDFYVIGKIINSEQLTYAWQPDGQPSVGNPFSEFSGFYSVKDIKKDETNNLNTNNVASAASTLPVSNSTNKNNTSDSSGSTTIKKSNNKESGTSGKESSNNNNVASSNTAKPGNNNTSGSGGIVKPGAGSNTGNTGKPGTVAPGNGSSEQDKKPVSLNKTLVNFESLSNMFFVGNNKDIIGNLQLNKAQKVEGKSSLSVKYDFVEKRKHNMANVSFNNQAIIQAQPEGISLSVNAVDKSLGSLGIIIRDREGDEHKLQLSDNLNWNGWQTVSVDLPIDINYPAVIERVYIETFEFYEKLTGEILIDDLKLIYDK